MLTYLQLEGKYYNTLQSLNTQYLANFNYEYLNDRNNEK